MSQETSKRLERLQVMISEEELEALEDWRFKSRMPSRAAAIRELLNRGLRAEGYFDEAQNGLTSRDFGILNTGEN